MEKIENKNREIDTVFYLAQIKNYFRIDNGNRKGHYIIRNFFGKDIEIKNDFFEIYDELLIDVLFGNIKIGTEVIVGGMCGKIEEINFRNNLPYYLIRTIDGEIHYEYATCIHLNIPIFENYIKSELIYLDLEAERVEKLLKQTKRKFVDTQKEQKTNDLYVPYKTTNDKEIILDCRYLKSDKEIELQLVKSMNQIVEKLDLLNSNLQEIHKIMKRKDWE